MPYTRRYNVVLAAGVASTTGLGWIVGSSIDVAAVYPIRAAAFFTVLFASVVSVAGADHPYPRFGAANWVTATRAMLSALAAGLVGYQVSAGVLWWVTALTALTAVLDGVDGWLARSTRMVSAFGARFDTETDAAFILVLSLLVWQHEKAGAWVLCCGLMRYAFVAAGRIRPWLAGPLRPTARGRAIAVLQVIGLGVALAPLVPRPWSAGVACGTLALLTWSFAIDVARLARQYRTPVRVQE